jgi:hypothetical protein
MLMGEKVSNEKRSVSILSFQSLAEAYKIIITVTAINVKVAVIVVLSTARYTLASHECDAASRNSPEECKTVVRYLFQLQAAKNADMSL